MAVVVVVAKATRHVLSKCETATVAKKWAAATTTETGTSDCSWAKQGSTEAIAIHPQYARANGTQGRSLKSQYAAIAGHLNTASLRLPPTKRITALRADVAS